MPSRWSNFNEHLQLNLISAYHIFFKGGHDKSELKQGIQCCQIILFIPFWYFCCLWSLSLPSSSSFPGKFLLACGLLASWLEIGVSGTSDVLFPCLLLEAESLFLFLCLPELEELNNKPFRCAEVELSEDLDDAPVWCREEELFLALTLLFHPCRDCLTFSDTTAFLNLASIYNAIKPVNGRQKEQNKNLK